MAYANVLIIHTQLVVPLAYLTAKTYGLEEEAQRLREKILEKSKERQSEDEPEPQGIDIVRISCFIWFGIRKLTYFNCDVGTNTSPISKFQRVSSSKARK